MSHALIEVHGLAKQFNRRTIFSHLTFHLETNHGLSIIGRNGSGKSTLVKILAGVLSQTDGTINFSFERNVIDKSNIFMQIGFVAPYLELYGEFTAFEHLDLVRRIRRIQVTDSEIDALLSRLNLEGARNQFVRTFSSGMMQRLKYVCALLHHPHILLLDEPTANLDAEGIKTVDTLMREQIKNGILIVATNDDHDLHSCDITIDLNTLVSVSRSSK